MTQGDNERKVNGKLTRIRVDNPILVEAIRGAIENYNKVLTSGTLHGVSVVPEDQALPHHTISIVEKEVK